MARDLAALIIGGCAMGWLAFTAIWAALNGHAMGAASAAAMLFFAIAKTTSVYRSILRNISIFDR